MKRHKTPFQLCADEWKRLGFNPLPWAILLNPMTPDERLVGNFKRKEEAEKYQEQHLKGQNSQVMKWTENYTLTTEF